MKPHDSDLYSKSKAFHDEAFVLMKKLEPVPGEDSLADMCDRAYALREAHRLVDRIRKDLEQHQEKLARLICLVWQKDPRYADGDNIKTPYCTVMPDIRMAVPLPTRGKDPENFAALCKDLGISEEATQCDAVRVHYPGMVELVTARTKAGKPLPAGVKHMQPYPIHKVSIRKGDRPIDS